MGIRKTMRTLLGKIDPRAEKWEYLIAPCPWCRKTPFLDVNYHENSGGTWRWGIQCTNGRCKIRPHTRLIGIRKTCKADLQRQKEKIQTIVDEWNEMNPFEAYEITIFYPHVRST